MSGPAISRGGSDPLSEAVRSGGGYGPISAAIHSDVNDYIQTYKIPNVLFIHRSTLDQLESEIDEQFPRSDGDKCTHLVKFNGLTVIVAEIASECKRSGFAVAFVDKVVF